MYSYTDEGLPLIVGDMLLEVKRCKLDQPEYYCGYNATVSISAQTPAGEVSGIDIPGELWKRFHTNKSNMTSFFKNQTELGVSHSPCREEDSFQYFAGGYIGCHNISLNNDLMIYTLEPGEYIVCKIEADSWENLVCNALYQANRYLFVTWLPKHKMSVQPFAAEKYYQDSIVDFKAELWLMIKV